MCLMDTGCSSSGELYATAVKATAMRVNVPVELEACQAGVVANTAKRSISLERVYPRTIRG